jgi:hypothetical protein
MAQNGHFLRRGADTIWFFVHHFVPLLADSRTCLYQLRLADRQGARLNFNHNCSVAVIEVHQPKLLSFGLYFTPATYEARIFDVLFKTLYGIVRYRTNTYILRAIRQRGVLRFPFGTTTSTPTIVS